MEKSQIKILLVDDEPDILEMVGYNLSSEGYQVLKAENGKKAIEIAKKETPHLIILDVMMPVMDGIETCEILRQDDNLANTTITFLTARNEEYSQIAGYNVGADDYITKPVKPKILISKVNALLRRSIKNENLVNIITIGDLCIDKNAYKVTKNNHEITLPKKEFELLFLLASQPGKVFKRDIILETIWGNDVVVGGRTIDVHIRKLREKIGDNSFKTVKGVGYKFVD